ncbi:hypothetical protein ACFOOK_07110 [Micromonospora krabiensis]|uniref:hypothetical protein n=1 Tax=Micromonospora krabiensis TaxID=307121 RepID=UPI000B89308B|nr:hypothetical protein [Micromonospora krabiensis]
MPEDVQPGHGPVAHEQDGSPVRPDRDSPAAPESRHHPDDPEEQMAPLASRATVTDLIRRPAADRDC